MSEEEVRELAFKKIKAIRDYKHSPSHMFLYSLKIGLLSGSFGGMIGIGGGNIAVPLMMMPSQLNLEPRMAIGTSTAVILATGLVGSASYFINGNGVESVDFVAAMILGLTSIPVAHMSARFSYMFSSSTIAVLMIIFVFLSIPLVLWPVVWDYLWPQEKREGEETEEEVVEDSVGVREPVTPWAVVEKTMVKDWQQVGALLGIGTVAGACSGMFGIGGGLVVVPLLSMFCNQELAQGTSLFAMLAPSAVAGYVHHKRGNVNLRLVPMLAAGAGLGAWISGYMATISTENTNRIIYSIVVGTLAVMSLRRRPLPKGVNPQNMRKEP